MTPERRIEGSQSDVPERKQPNAFFRFIQSGKARVAAALLAFAPAAIDGTAAEHGHAERPTAVGKAPALPGHTPLENGHAEHGAGTEAITNFTRVELQKILPDRIEYRTLEEILNLYRCHCVDGRETEAVAGVPGGDLGILMAGLTAYEKLTGTELSDDDVEALLAQYPLLYLHTDDHGTHALKEKLNKHPILKVVLEKKGIGRLLEEGAGDPELNKQLLEEASDPETVGCGHMKLMMKNPGAYGTRAALVSAVWKSSLRRNWEKTEAVQLDVLTGPHKEKAVAAVDMGGKMEKNTRVPTFLPNGKEGQMFVSHAAVAAYCLQEELPARLRIMAARRKLPMPDEHALSAAAIQNLKHMTLATVGELASRRPQFRLEPEEDGTITVEQMGIVGGK